MHNVQVDCLHPFLSRSSYTYNSLIDYRKFFIITPIIDDSNGLSSTTSERRSIELHTMRFIRVHFLFDIIHAAAGSKSQNNYIYFNCRGVVYDAICTLLAQTYMTNPRAVGGDRMLSQLSP